MLIQLNDWLHCCCWTYLNSNCNCWHWGCCHDLVLQEQRWIPNEKKKSKSLIFILQEILWNVGKLTETWKVLKLDGWFKWKHPILEQRKTQLAIWFHCRKMAAWSVGLSLAFWWRMFLAPLLITQARRNLGADWLPGDRVASCSQWPPLTVAVPSVWHLVWLTADTKCLKNGKAWDRV